MAMKFMLTSLDNVQTTQTDSSAAKTMALDHLGIIAARIRSISAKGRAGGAEPEDVHTLVSIKLVLKYTQPKRSSPFMPLPGRHQDRNLADFEKALCDYKDKLSSELTIRSHLAALYNTAPQVTEFAPHPPLPALRLVTLVVLLRWVALLIRWRDGGDVPALIASFPALTFVSDLAHLHTAPPPRLSSFRLVSWSACQLLSSFTLI
ncbi:hypothetical protein B0H14DRAFT_3523830 [Mycena olivaceomarginata]|nr:hypothetical protein B0H14DRAFT_3523830 [Mycena olivaceomarginata]